MPQSLPSLIGLCLILVVCSSTAIVGGWRERVAALSFLLAVLASITVQQASTAWDPVLPLAAIDVVLMAVLGALAWRSRLAWPVWAVALQGLTVAIDGLRIAEIGMEPYSYLAAVNLSSYGLAVVIAYAGWAAWRGRRSA